MKSFKVTGMSCSACSARVEKAVLKVKGVKKCSVSLLMGTMVVEGDFDDQEVINGVKNAGYGAMVEGKFSNQKDDKKDKQTKQLIIRLTLSIILSIVLMYFSMGVKMFGFFVPQFLNNSLTLGLIQMFLALSVILINNRYYISGITSVIHKSPNMDTLVSLGSGVSFIYSTYCLFVIASCISNHKIDIAKQYYDKLYYESSAMILTLITIGKTLESYSKGKTTKALKNLISLKPLNVTVLRNGETVIGINEVKIGDIVVVRPGESIPVDGVITKGFASVNQSQLTGESVPVDKTVGDEILSGTINQSGYLEIKANRVGEDTTLSKIIKTVTESSASKAPIAKIADKVSGVFVPVVLILALITTIIWVILKKDMSIALTRGITVLVISCPCALGLATPVAIMVGNGVGARNGILFKNATALENLGKTKIVILDKTGTITQGEPLVNQVIPYLNHTEEEVLTVGYNLELKSLHPFAKAVVKYGDNRHIAPLMTEDFCSYTGFGVSGVIQGNRFFGGNLKFIQQNVFVPDDIIKQMEELSKDCKTPLLFASQFEVLGIITVSDMVKKDSYESIKQLNQMGIETVMVTGDNYLTAKKIADQVGISKVYAEVLPEGKNQICHELKKKGKVLMVGDGINDALPITTADVGMAIGAGADIAMDVADVVLFNSNLKDVPASIKLSKKTLLNIYENLFWAFIYNIIGIPLASGVFSGLGWELSPMIGALCMSLSSFCVVTNALRLNFCNIYKHNKTKKENFMTKTIKISGMMCSHCENRVYKTLIGIDGVISAEVSFKKGIAKIQLSKEVNNDIITQKIQEQDYTVLSIE